MGGQGVGGGGKWEGEGSEVGGGKSEVRTAESGNAQGEHWASERVLLISEI